MKILAFFAITLLFISSCTGPSFFNRAYVEIGMEEEGLGLNPAKKIAAVDAGGKMSPERFLFFKGEEKRQKNLAMARVQLDSAIKNHDFATINKLQFVIERLNYYGEARNGYLMPIQTTNRPIRPVTIINNSSRVIKFFSPYSLRGLELGPGEQTPVTISIPMGLNKIAYTEYELGNSRNRNRRINVYIKNNSNKLIIADR